MKLLLLLPLLMVGVVFANTPTNPTIANANTTPCDEHIYLMATYDVAKKVCVVPKIPTPIIKKTNQCLQSTDTEVNKYWYMVAKDDFYNQYQNAGRQKQAFCQEVRLSFDEYFGGK